MPKPTRTTTAAVTALVLIAASAAVGCGRADGTTVAGPSKISAERGGVERSGSPAPVTAVLARAAQQPLNSGHVEVRAGSDQASPPQMVASFQGDDVSMRMVGSEAPGEAFAGAEMLLVDGEAYVRMGESYLNVPFGADVLTSSAGSRISDTIASVRHLLEKATVDEAGTPMTVDGVAVTRYRADLTGVGVADLLAGADDWRAELPDDEQLRSAVDDAMARTSVTLVGDIDAEGMLRRLEVTVSVDAASSPDCDVLRHIPTTSIVLSGIDQPQQITAPPADQVKDVSEMDPSALFDEITSGFGGDRGLAPLPADPGSSLPTPSAGCPD